MIKSIIRLLLIAIVLAGIYFAVAMVVTGIWIKLVAAALILLFIWAVVATFNLDIPGTAGPKLLLIAILPAFSSCASLKDGDKWAQTGAMATQLITDTALTVLLQNATSPMDMLAKANWSDSLAEGVRTASEKILNWRTLSNVWNIWLSPAAPPHWEEIEKKVKDIVATRKMTPEEVAIGLNKTAKILRDTATDA